MSQRIFTIIFFLIVLGLGLAIYKDYGISLDEPAQRLIGIVNANYVAKVLGINTILENSHFLNFSNQTLDQLQDRHYGVIFELPAALIELFVDPNNSMAIYQARHLLTFIYFLFGLVGLYFLANLRYKNWKVSLLACAMLIMSPRIFADAFYNSKDIVFLSAYILSALTMARYLIQPTITRALIHAFITAIAIDTRLISISIPILTISLLLLISFKNNIDLKGRFVSATLYLIMSAAFVIIFYPYLWSAPLKNLLESFRSISVHLHSGSLLYLGNSVPNNLLPWHYLPVWIGISTPPLYILFFVLGAILTLYEIGRERANIFHNENRILDFIFLGLLMGPILLVTISNTHIYNGWRHLYFVYPFLILLAIKGFMFFWRLFNRYRYIQVTIFAIFMLNFAYIAGWMYTNHPLQNLYFNSLASKQWGSLFELDYWGLANRLALKKILSIDHSESISIWPGKNSKFKSGEPTVFSDQLLLETSINRSKVFSPDNIEDSKYIIASRGGNFSSGYLSEHGALKKIDSIKVDNVEIVSVFQLLNIESLTSPKKGEKISFSKDGVGIFYLNGGNSPPINWEHWNSKQWQIPENWGTWTNGNFSTLKLLAPHEAVNKIKIKLRAFNVPQTSSQNIQIWIDGLLIKNLSVSSDKGQEFSIDLPRNFKFNNPMKIEFRNLIPHSPKELGLSEDARKIAIGLESIEFE